MQGKRLPDDSPYYPVQPGTYWKRSRDNVWNCVTPNGHLGRLDLHNVVEHEDGTISVSPSILVSDHTGELWHGFLEAGSWRSC